MQSPKPLNIWDSKEIEKLIKISSLDNTSLYSQVDRKVFRLDYHFFGTWSMQAIAHSIELAEEQGLTYPESSIRWVEPPQKVTLLSGRWTSSVINEVFKIKSLKFN